VRPRKSRGQNFLVQEAVARRIVRAAELEPDDAVIEIGPGLGVLTNLIAAHPVASLTLIELDAALAAALAERFRSNPRVNLINEDFLRVELDQIDGGRSIKVIGNLPFNLAAAILERLCVYQSRISRMVLMFQREVADRIRAGPGTSEYGALSVFTALYWNILDHFLVAAGNFHPAPNVDARVLTFAPKSKVIWSDDEENAIRATIRAAFSAPRKTVRNALAAGSGLDPRAAEQALIGAEIDPSKRAGALALEDFIRLARSLMRGAHLSGSNDA
jgi:16S rRNA (adenine1518-N6/adenine1519-N6)-dimethyltransferase